MSGSTDARFCHSARRPLGAFTLIEMLITIVLLGIAAALVVPSMSSTGVLRVQSAVRTLVSDLTFAQSDAMAFQERRAVVFDAEQNSYRIVAVTGDEIDADNNTLYNPDGPGQLFVVDLDDPRFAGARISAVEFDGDEGSTLIYDDLGGPVKDPSGNEASNGGQVRISGSGEVYIVTIEPFTGRIVVAREGAGGAG